MKRLWLALIVLMVGTGFGGITAALLGASAAPSSATLTTGRLQLTGNRDNGDRIPGPLFYTTATEGQTPAGRPGRYPTGLWAPGDTHHRVLQIENTGTLDAWLLNVRASLVSGSRSLADQLQVKITTDAVGTVVVAAGTLGQFLDADQAFVPSPLSSSVGEITNLHFWVSAPQSLGNSYQGLSTVVSFSVYAEQKAHNP